MRLGWIVAVRIVVLFVRSSNDPLVVASHGKLVSQVLLMAWW